MSWASLIHFPPIPDVPAFARGRSFAVVMAAFLGSEADGRALLRPLRDLGPERDTFAMVPPVVLADLAMDPLDPLPFHLAHRLLDELPAEAIDALHGQGRARLRARRHRSRCCSSATWAARSARERPGAGARATLPGEVLMMALGVVSESEVADAAVRAARGRRRRRRAAAPRRRTTRTSSRSRPTRATSSTPRRRGAAARRQGPYDPDDLFAGNHHVPPAD